MKKVVNVLSNLVRKALFPYQSEPHILEIKQTIRELELKEATLRALVINTRQEMDAISKGHNAIIHTTKQNA